MSPYLDMAFRKNSIQTKSKIFQNLCQLLGIRKSRTTAYNPKSDGMVERFNRILVNILVTMLESEIHQKDWDKYLPMVTAAYRSTVHETTRETRNMMIVPSRGHSSERKKETKLANSQMMRKTSKQTSKKHRRAASTTTEEMSDISSTDITDINPNNLDGLFVPIMIYEKKYNFLVDTGATESYISRKVYVNIPKSERPPIRPYDGSARLADGSPLCTDGKVIFTRTKSRSVQPCW